jgi:hypothetical protein
LIIRFVPAGRTGARGELREGKARPALSEGGHRGLAHRLVGVRRSAVFGLPEGVLPEASVHSHGLPTGAACASSDAMESAYERAARCCGTASPCDAGNVLRRKLLLQRQSDLKSRGA